MLEETLVTVTVKASRSGGMTVPPCLRRGGLVNMPRT